MEEITTINNLNDFLTGIAKNEKYPKGLRLNFFGNQLDKQGAKALANALRSGQCPQGLQLNIGLNQLGIEDVKVLTMALQSGQCPQRLQLAFWHTQIGVDVAEAAAIALQSGQCPQGLQLAFWHNNIGDKGVKALALALQSGQCPQGLQLDLNANQLSAKGMQMLAIALQSGRCPQGLKLDLRNNQIGTEGAIALAMALLNRRCPQGLQLDLYYNLQGNKVRKSLEQAWAVYYAHQQDDFINCISLYQGHSQVDSLFNRLPQELLLEIYAYILPATPILAKMTEISAKVFQAQLSTHKLAVTSVHAEQLDNALETALSAQKFTEKAAKVRTAINDFLYKTLATSEVEKVVRSPTVALLNKYHLLTKNTIQLAALSRKTPADELEDQPPLKKIKL